MAQMIMASVDGSLGAADEPVELVPGVVSATPRSTSRLPLNGGSIVVSGHSRRSAVVVGGKFVLELSRPGER